ncbi:MAG: phosphatidylserine decarboxylase [Candidatus Nomurabacteria bacterium]|nr:phosphatidylserine decarboxylase [Candidatus Nomurabacteria bacterium]
MKKIFIKIGWVIIGLIVLFGIATAIFNRTPTRDIPTDLSDIVSPAHGTVIGVEPITDEVISFVKKGTVNEISVPDTFIGGTMVVIELRIKNIHAQRAPYSGVVSYVEHIPGKHANAIYNDDVTRLATENEKFITIIDTEHGPIGVVQVSGLVARRIINKLEIGDTVERGQMIGRILLGSQTLLLLPPNSTELVEMEQIVVDGESVIGNW